MTRHHSNQTQSITKAAAGFSLIEIIFYIFLLLILFALIIQTIVTLSGTFPLIDEGASVNRTGIFGIERVMRETRNAKSVDQLTSVLAATSSTLVINTEDENGDNITRSFYILNDAIHMSENGTDQGALTPDDVVVTELWFYRIANGDTSEAVKMEVSLRPNDPTADITTFYNTAVLRDSY